jgi:hydrogenase maturation protease
MSDDRGAPVSALVIGLGNLDRGDDGAGLLVARSVRAADPRAEVVEARDEAACLEALRTARDIIVIDAMRSGAALGSVRRIDLDVETLPTSFAPRSTHVLGLATVIELARALNVTPGHIVVYGVEGRTFDLGSPMSREVRSALESTTSAVLAELRRSRLYAGVADA